jgi:hypothetical protein
MKRRLRIKPSRQPVMVVYRKAVQSTRLVYLICIPSSRKYPKGRSRIIYIGTTEKGVHRAASSMSSKAIDFLETRGVKRLDVYFVTCPPRTGLSSWRRLERDPLITFKNEYGVVPASNRSGKNFTVERLSGYFPYRRLVKVLDTYRVAS